MVATQHRIRVRQNGSRILFHVEGWAKMDLSLALRRFAEACLAKGANTLLVDLRECEYMDSTFLGTLFLLKRAAERRRGRFALVSPSAPCVQLLDQMGATELLPIEADEELVGGEWIDLEADVNDVEAFQLNVLQAHEQLVDLPGPAAKPFKKLVKMMAAEMEARQGPG